jgi:hypothetical protein
MSSSGLKQWITCAFLGWEFFASVDLYDSCNRSLGDKAVERLVILFAIEGFSVGLSMALLVVLFLVLIRWHILKRIEYEEQIRGYLIGAEPFSKNISLVTYLDAKTPPFLAAIPPRRFQADGFHLFVLYLNGLQCSLCVGKGIPFEYRVTCLASAVEHPIFVMPSVGENILQVTKETVRDSKPSMGILATFKSWRKLKEGGKIV